MEAVKILLLLASVGLAAASERELQQFPSVTYTSPKSLPNIATPTFKLRKTPSETKAAAEERQARAERLRAALTAEKQARLKQEQLTKQQRRKAESGGASAAAAKAIEDKYHRSEVRRAAHIKAIRAKANDEIRKVEEVAFINSLNNEGRKADLQQRLEEGEARRLEALAAILAKQQGVDINVREAAQRRRQAEADKAQRLADKQRRSQEAQAKVLQERQAAAAAREAAKAAAKAVAQQREAERQRQAQLLSGRINARLKEAARRSTSRPASPAAITPLPSEVAADLEGHSQSIAQAGFLPASCQRTSLRGARRRMAKARTRLLEPQGYFMEHEDTMAHSRSQEAQQLLTTWAPHLAVLQAQHSSLQVAAAVATAAGQAPGTLAAALDACCAQIAGHNPHGQGSAMCLLEPLLLGGGFPAPQQRLPSEADRRDALAALVGSARSHLAKQPLLVFHLARQAGLLQLMCREVLAVAEASPTDLQPAGRQTQNSKSAGATSAEHQARHAKLQQAHLYELLGRLLELPLNLDYLLASGSLLPVFAKAALAALDHCSSLEADEPSMVTGGEAASRLSMLLQVLVAVLEHDAGSQHVCNMQQELVGYMVAAGMLRRLANVFSLFDQPMKDAARPVPPYVLQCLRLLRGLTAVRCPSHELLVGKRWPVISPHTAAIIMELQATSMAGVLSLLTAVLLNAAPSCTPAEASSKALPPNFVEAAHLVMSVLNNVCCLDLQAAQHMLSCTHNRLEFFHLISFLLSYCSSRWPAAAPGPAAASAARSAHQDKAQQERLVAAVLSAADGEGGNQWKQLDLLPISASARHAGQTPCHAAKVMLLVGYFCVLHPSNQAMLQWGRSPSILQRLCSLPEQYLTVPELRAVAMPTLLARCSIFKQPSTSTKLQAERDVAINYSADT
eukprot:gene10480-10639_t